MTKKSKLGATWRNTNTKFFANTRTSGNDVARRSRLYEENQAILKRITKK